MALSRRALEFLLSAVGDPAVRDEIKTAIDNAATIETAEIADSAVTTDKINDLAVTTAKLAAGAVTTAKIAASAVTATELGAGAVTNAKIGAGAVTNTEVDAAAAIAFSKLAALNSANILVGNGSNVAASVAVSGDITISNAGVTAIGADKVLASMISSTDALKVQKFSVGYAALNSAGTGVAALFGTAIPDNAIIKRVYYDVTTTFNDNGTAGNADSATIKVGLEDQDNDVVAAVAISDGTNPWDAGLHEGIQVGTAATMLKHTAARQLAATFTAGTGDSTALVAGAMDVFVEWVQGS